MRTVRVNWQTAETATEATSWDLTPPERISTGPWATHKACGLENRRLQLFRW